MTETLDRAWLLMNHHRFEQSEHQIREHLSTNPEDPRAHTTLAICLSDLHRYPEAIESAAQAIALLPDNPYPYWVLGCIYIRSQQPNLAEAYLLEAIELDPACSGFYASLAELYWLRGSTIDSSSSEKRSYLYRGSEAASIGLELDPTHQDCIIYLVRNLLALEDREYIPKLLKITEELLSIAPENAIAHEIHAQALICELSGKPNRQEVDRILAIIKESLRIDPTRSSPKNFARSLLELHYKISPNLSPWLRDCFSIVVMLSLPLLILTLCFYHTWGLQIYPTGTAVIATLVGSIFMLEKTYVWLRIWLHPHDRHFSHPTPIFNIFWGAFILILAIGLTWQLLPIWLTKIVSVLLWASLILFGLLLPFILRRAPFLRGSIVKIVRLENI
jgi:tetratricopeptide (TPR) repeat protein